MKKIYFFLWVICNILLLPACSEDEQKDPDLMNPVKNAIVPEQGLVGNEVSVWGAGFTAEGRIFLKNTKGEVEAIITDRTPEGITFKVASDLLAGIYDVILRQSGDWKLGSLKLIIFEQPVHDAVIQKEVVPGGEVIISGQGFNIISEIYLQQGEQEPMIMQVMNMDNNSITFFVPETFPEGDYKVILRQNGDWELGNIKVRIPLLVKVIREKDYNVLTRTFEYDDQERMTAMLVKSEWGELELSYTLVYSGNESLKVTITGTDTVGKAVDVIQEYTLKDGRVIRQGEHTFDYDEEGFLTTVHDVKKVDYLYEDNKITTIIVDDDMSRRREYTYGLPLKNNQTGIDLMAFAFDSMGEGMFNYEVEMRLWGISGRYSESLPTYVMEWTSWDSNSFTYEYTGILLSKILLNYGNTNAVYTFSYK